MEMGNVSMSQQPNQKAETPKHLKIIVKVI